MADLLGIVDYTVTSLLDKVVEEIKNVIYCKEYCHTLGELLETVRPLVSSAHEKLSTSSSAGTSGAVAEKEAGAGPVKNCWEDLMRVFFCCMNIPEDPVFKAPESSRPQPVKKWLEDLMGVVMEGGKVVSECKVSGWNALERRILARKLLDITQKITEICTIQAPLATLNVGIDTLQAVSVIEHKISKVDGTLDEIHQAVVQGNEKLAEIKVKLDVPSAADTLYALRQEPKQTFGMDDQLDTLQSVSVIEHKISKLDGTLDEIHQAVVQGNEKLAEIEVKLDVPSAAETLYALRQEPKQTFGMDDQLDDLQGLLIGESTKYIGIYGTGGMGKTLLTTRACNSEIVQNHFQKHIYWLTVGRNPEIRQLLQSLCDDLNISTKSAEPDDKVKQKLFGALRRKKVLLVVDDVWNDGVPLLKSLDVTSDNTGSKILVTTREIQVLDEQTAQGTTRIKIRGLSEMDSMKLFCHRAWGSVEEIPLGLDKELVKDVVAECKGLPLALEVIAGSQAGQKLNNEWRRTLMKLKEAEKFNLSLELQVYDKLKLSYDALASVDRRLQKCFLYFCAFPEDGDVNSEELVNLWAAEKLLQTGLNNKEDLLDEGYYLLGELIGRSLIELREERLHAEPRYSTRVQLTCCVHDVLRDLGLRLIKEGKAAANMDCLFSAGKGLNNFPDEWLTPTQPQSWQSRGPTPATSRATHISLSHNRLKALPEKLKAPKVEVLLLNNNWKRWRDFPLVISAGFLESFSSLKVLDLHKTKIDSLPKTLGKLTNLIYLDLSKTGLRQVPVQLEKLTKLEFLNLRDCKKIKQWSFDISCLKMLSTLDTKGCRHIWRPLHNLQKCSSNSPSLPPSLDSLCSLRALQNLSMEGVQENLPSQFSSLVNLCYLEISFKNLKKLPSTLHSWSGPSKHNLQFFSLRGCQDLSELPSWVASLSQLSHLYLCGCKMLTALPNLDNLQNLRVLDLGRCQSLLRLPPGLTTRRGCPSLQELDISGCEKLHKLPRIEDGAFARLKYLSMRDCSFSELPEGFATKGAFPSLKKLAIRGCTKLQKFPPIEYGAFGQLKTFDMEGCSSLVEPPDAFISKGAFQSLKVLR